MKLTIAVCSVLALSSLAIVGTPDFDATDDDLLSEHVIAIASGDEKSDFVQVTQTRVKMKNPVAQLCREPFPSELQHNLHGDKYLHVFVNKLGLKVFRSGTGAYPQGSIIAKQKFTDNTTVDAELFTVMRKMKDGYDPKHGNWEYSVLSGDGKTILSRGRIDSCITCHSKYSSRDFVSRSYMVK